MEAAQRTNRDLRTDRRRVVVAYALSLFVAVAAGAAGPSGHPVGIALQADVAATIAIFVASVVYRNSSFYDAYWSVAPIAIGLYFAVVPQASDVSAARPLLVLALVTLWGVRLTWNWLRGWEGLHHEDWRYRRIAEQTGPFYWPVSFLGIHMLPTLLVFAGCLPLYAALSIGSAPLGFLDGVALCVTLLAIWLEARADRELLAFRRSGPAPGSTLATGLWSLSRHPNYLGEIGFWWGLALFGIAAAPSTWWWSCAGALAITLLFRVASLPLIETRMRESRPGWDAHAERVPILLPTLRR